MTRLPIHFNKPRAEPLGDLDRQDIIKALKWKTFPVLDKGYVCLVDVMGCDHDIVEAARVSYGAGTKHTSDDRALLRYMMRHFHTTPFEQCELIFMIQMPMDAHRQQIRHRTACLTGDTLLTFDLPGKRIRKLTRTVSQIYKLFHKGISCTADRAKLPHYTEKVNSEIWYTAAELGKLVGRSDVQIRNCIRSGSLKANRSQTPLIIKGSCWHDYAETGTVTTTTIPMKKRVCNMRLRNMNEESHQVSHTHIKDIWSSGIKEVLRVTFSNGGVIEATKNHLCFTEKGWLKLGDALAQEVQFWSSGYNNRKSNLAWGSDPDNTDDRMKQDGDQTLTGVLVNVTDVENIGFREVFDLSVTSKYHNFFAGGVVVHNSVNEYSTRYSEAIDDKQETQPDQWRTQSTTNKQGSGGFVTEWPKDDDAPLAHVQKFYDAAMTPGSYLTKREQRLHEFAKEIYEERLQFGVAREQARKDLPLSTYTRYRWKIDLHNLLHYLFLRMDGHAQQEIRAYADVIGNEIIAKLFPLVWEAFIDYRMNAVSLTRLDIEVLNHIITNGGYMPIRNDIFLTQHQHKEWEGVKTCRERDECLTKLRLLGIVREEDV